MGVKTLYCKFCGVAVKELPEGIKHMGRGKTPKYVHVTKRSDKDPVQCTRANLYEDQVTEEDWWYGGSKDPGDGREGEDSDSGTTVP